MESDVGTRPSRCTSTPTFSVGSFQMHNGRKELQHTNVNADTEVIFAVGTGTNVMDSVKKTLEKFYMELTDSETTSVSTRFHLRQSTPGERSSRDGVHSSLLLGSFKEHQLSNDMYCNDDGL